MVRFILNLPPRHTIGKKELNKVGYTSIKNRAAQLTLNIVHNISINKGPMYLKGNFERSDTIHTHQTRSSARNFFIPISNSYIQKTFYFSGIVLWNSLPDYIKDYSKVNSFRRSLKRYLMSQN